MHHIVIFFCPSLAQMELDNLMFTCLGLQLSWLSWLEWLELLFLWSLIFLEPSLIFFMGQSLDSTPHKGCSDLCSHLIC